jgi:hypothetical protein
MDLSSLIEESDFLQEKIEHCLVSLQELCLDAPQESQIKVPVEGPSVQVQ